ncbi:histidine kinase [Streptomyces lasalocidi]
MSVGVSNSPGPVLPALRYTWAGLRTLRSTWVLSGLVVLLQLCFALADSRVGSTGTEQFIKGLSLMPLLTAVLIAALGVNTFGMEYRHRTIATTVLTLRSPARIVAAKALVVAAVGTGTAGVAAAVDYLGVLTIGQTSPDSGRALAAAGATVLYVTLTGLVGLAVAGLTRSAVAALCIAVLWLHGAGAAAGGRPPPRSTGGTVHRGQAAGRSGGRRARLRGAAAAGTDGRAAGRKRLGPFPAGRLIGEESRAGRDEHMESPGASPGPAPTRRRRWLGWWGGRFRSLCFDVLVTVMVLEGVSVHHAASALLAMCALVVCAPALLLRRRFPWLAVAATVTVAFTGAVSWMACVAGYTAARRWGRAGRLWIASGLLSLAMIPGYYRALAGSSDRLAYVVVVPLLAVAASVLLGLWVFQRDALLASLQDRAEQAERERDLLAERAVEAERRRIAREMHDVVAHRVSVISLQAGWPVGERSGRSDGTDRRGDPPYQRQRSVRTP